MIQIIKKVDLSKMWGKEQNIHSVTDLFGGKFFSVNLDKGEMLPIRYSCDNVIMAQLEALHGHSNVVVISKSVKANKPDAAGVFRYNDTIVEVMTLSAYVKKSAQVDVFVSKFAVARQAFEENAKSDTYHVAEASSNSINPNEI